MAAVTLGGGGEGVVALAFPKPFADVAVDGKGSSVPGRDFETELGGGEVFFTAGVEGCVQVSVRVGFEGCGGEGGEGGEGEGGHCGRSWAWGVVVVRAGGSTWCVGRSRMKAVGELGVVVALGACWQLESDDVRPRQGTYKNRGEDERTRNF